MSLQNECNKHKMRPNGEMFKVIIIVTVVIRPRKYKRSWVWVGTLRGANRC